MPRALELFCGTKSVGKVLREHGWEVTSVDIAAKFEPTFCADVLDWDYTAAFSPGEYDYVHLSPPCQQYSSAMWKRPRRLDQADRLVQQGLRILDYARPRWWTIENPDCLLKTRPCMQPLAQFMRRVCYCKYSDGNPRWSYRKRTCIWTNLSAWTPRPMCCRACPCEWVQFPHGKHVTRVSKLHTSLTYAMPPALIKEWVASMASDRGQSISAGAAVEDISLESD